MMQTPTLQPWLTATVEIGPRRSLGPWQGGERFIVPILGGRLSGAGLSGQVLPGGADRQWLRPDGVKELEAVYEVQLHDDTVISVHNQVLVDETLQPRYACSHARLRAPDGPWAWLNRRMIVGDVHSLRPRLEAVEVRFFILMPSGVGA